MPHRFALPTCTSTVIFLVGYRHPRITTMKYNTLGLMGLASLALASDVHDLTKDTFEPFVKEHGLVLAECKLPPQGR